MTDYPWQAPYVRAEVKRGYTVRIPEPLYLRLRYLAEHSPESMAGIILAGIEREVAERLERAGVVGNEEQGNA